MNEGMSNNSSRQENQEQLSVIVELATEKDWEEYKKLRLMAISGKDAEMFDRSEVKKDQAKGDEEWQEDLSDSENAFFVLARINNEAVGTGKTINKGNDVWKLSFGYVKEDLQGQGIGKKIWTARIEEIRRRGGLKVVAGIEYHNEKSLGVAMSLGFKKVGIVKRFIKTGRVRPIAFQEVELDLIESKQ